MKSRRSSACVFSVLLAVFSAHANGGSGCCGSGTIDRDIVSAVAELHSLSEEQAIDRLAREARAVAIHGPLKSFLGEYYAGAWFDPEFGGLVVAITDEGVSDWVRVTGSRPVLVEYSLEDLRSVMAHLGEEVSASWRTYPATPFTGWSIHYPTNQVVARYEPGRGAEVEEFAGSLRRAGLPVTVKEGRGRSRLGTSLRAGEGFQNTTQGKTCSIGFSVAEGGFVTAGHCGWNGASVSYSGQNIGSFAGSTWPPDLSHNAENDDVAWVSVNPGVTPLAEVEGYSDGILPVPGTSFPPMNTHVCRYGTISWGPHCGTVQALGATEYFDHSDDFPGAIEVRVTGLIGVNTCSDRGDSGGPLLQAANSHASGLTVGGSLPCSGPQSFQPFDEPPDPGNFFEPVGVALSEFQLTLLTSSGPEPPDITTFVCPDHDNSGQGIYFCYVEYDTFGPTSVSWTSNTGNSSNNDGLFGSCSSGFTVNVSVTVTNDYGSDQRSANFPCPTGPLN